MTGLDIAIDVLGRAGVAEACGLKTPESVTNWKARGGMVPPKHCQRLQLACREKGTELTLHELNSEFFIKDVA